MATPELPEGGRTTDPPVDLPGPDHRAEPGTGAPNAFWRTLLQVGPAAAFGLLLILPQILQTVTDQFGQQLPPEVYAALLAITATVTLVAAIAAKVMSIPAVQVWIARYAPFFAATKK